MIIQLFFVRITEILVLKYIKNSVEIQLIYQHQDSSNNTELYCPVQYYSNKHAYI